MFTPDALFVMADKLYEEDPTRPEVALVRAVIASTCTGKLTTDVYQYARDAAAVSEKIRLQGGLTNSSPLDMSTEWKAHRLAAIAAANIAKKHPENMPLVRDHIAAGLAAGGPWAFFKGIADDAGVSAEATQ